MTDKILAIDIGGTFIKYGLIRDHLEIDQLDKIHTPKSMTDFEDSLSRIISYFSDIKGIAISCTGEINKQTGLVLKGGLITYLYHYPLGKKLTEIFHLPVTVINDAVAAALAEGIHGNLREVNCGAALVLGSGVGGALTCQGDIFSLKQLFLEQLFSQKVTEIEKTPVDQGRILKIYQHDLISLINNQGSAVNFITSASQLLDMPKPDGKAVFQVLEEGKDHGVSRLFEDYCKEITYLILGLQALTPLDKVVIGGGISSQPLLIQEINRQYQVLLNEEAQYNQVFKEIPIQACYYQNDSNLLGAYCHFEKQVNETPKVNTFFQDLSDILGLDILKP